MKKVYLAGFDVFYLDAKERGEELKRICNKYGYEGLYPLDNEVIEEDKIFLAEKIFKGNIDLIKEADIIIANLNNFRGFEPDSGTAFECGVGYALGKQLYGYIDDDSSIVNKYPNKTFVNGIYLDENNMFIEDFDMTINLMLGCSVKVIKGGFENCIKHVKQ